MSMIGITDLSSVFDERETEEVIPELIHELKNLYQADNIPWVIGYSGGKDSTAVTALVWSAISELPVESRSKPVYVITNDTLVENPVVSAWVGSSHNKMNDAASSQAMPFTARILSPEIGNTFWVNLIGRGYPAPRHKFRWCTERLKIKPSNKFIRQVVDERGEVILFLGARRKESVTRQQAFRRRKEEGRHLSKHSDLPNTTVCTPIEDWSNDDVWTYLATYDNPWGHGHDELMALYRGATQDNECPVVVDTSTPSCGNSRFGCWTCTLVDKDKSMGAMIQNDEQKGWMQPLLDVRNELDFRGDENRAKDRERRDYRRMSGALHFYESQDGLGLIPGPYTQAAREDWLRLILETQNTIRADTRAPDYVQTLELITLEELEEIRRIWVEDKKEIEDTLPKVYQQVTGDAYPGSRYSTPIPETALKLLSEMTSNDERYRMARNIIALEAEYSVNVSRRGIYEQLEQIVFSGSFDSEVDALEWAKNKETA